YILYGVICLNALILFGFYLLALRAVGAGNSADSESAGGPLEERGEQENLTDDSVENRRPGIWSDRTNRIIFAFSVIFHLLMFITPFLLSTDVFDYIRHGLIFAF
ncbi:MAG: hypothetical protein AABZ63_04715, partial [Actinomycetota bacterium]